MKTAKWLVAIFIAIFMSTSICNAQEDEEKEKGHVYTLSTHKVGFQDIKGFIDVLEQFKEIWIENEFILSHKVMTHIWGPDWTILVISEYADFSSIEKAQVRTGELIKEKFEDKEKLKELTAKYQQMIVGHSDAIVREVPMLTK